MAKDKVMMGSERRSLTLSDHERRVTAYHEGGHALVALLQEDHDPLHKVTIVPRGRALGVTMSLPTEDRYTATKSQLLASIAFCMGGRAAEDVVFEQFSTGASDDLAKATKIAREMVCTYGMSEKIGPVAVADSSGQPFLGRALSHQPKHSEQTAREVDIEVERMLSGAYQLAKGVICSTGSQRACSSARRSTTRSSRSWWTGASFPRSPHRSRRRPPHPPRRATARVSPAWSRASGTSRSPSRSPCRGNFDTACPRTRRRVGLKA